MPDINLIKTGDISITLPQKVSSLVANFSFATIPGTGAAAGFKFFQNSTESNLLDWSIELRFVNGSSENIIVNQVNCEFHGKKWYVSKSRKSVFITEEVVGARYDRHFPLMISANSGRIFHFDFILEIYRKFFFLIKKTSFKENEVVAPKTYQDLIKK